MIHLDRGHSSAIAGHSKSNLILADPPHADQHSLLPWSPSTRTDTSFYHESQETFTLTSDAPKSTTPSDPLSAGQKQEHPSSTTNHGPITPGDAEEPKLPEPSPSSPAGPHSPVADTSSSLTPPPDAATPSATAAQGANADKPSTAGGETAAAESEALREEDKADVSEEVEKASRASTPLSELSSAPDDEEEDKTKEEDTSAGGQKEPHEADGPNKSVQETATSRGHVSAASNAQSPREAPSEASSSHPNPAKSASDAKGSSIGLSSSSAVSSPFSQPDFASLGSDVSLPSHVPNLTASAGAKLDSKVVTTLELTNQLLRYLRLLYLHKPLLTPS